MPITALIPAAARDAEVVAEAVSSATVGAEMPSPLVEAGELPFKVLGASSHLFDLIRSLSPCLASSHLIKFSPPHQIQSTSNVPHPPP